jgi:hypothetical protein
MIRESLIGEPTRNQWVDFFFCRGGTVRDSAEKDRERREPRDAFRGSALDKHMEIDRFISN